MQDTRLADTAKKSTAEAVLLIVGFRLSLGELRSATSGLETVLLSFLHTRVTRQETCLLEQGLVGFVGEDERTGDAVTDRACLPGDAAAADGGDRKAG